MDELLLQMIANAPTMLGLLLLWFEQRSINTKLFNLVVAVLEIDEAEAQRIAER